MLPYFGLLLFLALFAVVISFVACRYSRRWTVLAQRMWRVCVAAFVSCVFFGFVFWMHVQNGWGAARLPRFSGTSFYDLRYAVTTRSCFVSGFDLDAFTLCGSVYPAIWGFLFSLLEPSDSLIETLGLILAALMSISIGLLLWLSYRGWGNPWMLASLFLAFFSPPMLFVTYLGNVEIVVFFLVIIGLTIFILSNKFLLQVFATLVLGFAAYVKPTTVASGIGIFGRKMRLRQYVLLLAVSAVLPLIALSSEVSRLLSFAYSSWHVSFGTRIVGLRTLQIFGLETPQSSFWLDDIDGAFGFGYRPTQMIGMAVFAVLVVAVLFVVSTQRRSRIPKSLDAEISALRASPLSWILFLAGTSLYLTSFLFGSSYDYRLIYLILTLTSVAATRTSVRGTNLSKFLTLLILGTLYFSLVPFPLLGRLGFYYYEVPGEFFNLALAVITSLIALRGLSAQLKEPLLREVHARK